MAEEIPVNLHCHSIFSDGEQTPETLAGGLAAAGVRCAALTDHDTVEGLPRFQDALSKRGIACVSGVELTTQFAGREAHLLGYGFDQNDPMLAATLSSLRQVRGVQVISIAGSMRMAGVSRANSSDTATVASAAPDGRLEIADGIALIHRAGGRAFWAHPLLFESNLARLDAMLGALKSKGLDGIEAIFAPFTEAQRASLCALARKHELLISAGTDVHGNGGPRPADYAILMPRDAWLAFRSALFAAPAFAETRTFEAAAVGAQVQEGGHGSEGALAGQPGPAHGARRRSNVLRIVLPTLVAIALFLAAFWGIILPAFERTLLERKREMIRELTQSAWSILASHEHQVQSGALSREQAQAAAIAVIGALRYGPEGKDYFWIQDMQPRMVMHPYRTDLNGKDLSRFADSRGVPIFVQFAALVRREGQGYIDYVWQWKDDPTRLEAKESYVKGFAPWGWVIGTGLYIDDVRQEIAAIERSLILAALAIFAAIVLLLLYVLQQSLRIEHERQDVLDSLRQSTERFHALVEAATEGALLVLDDRCRYANPTLLSMLGYSARQLEFLELADVLPRGGGNAAIWSELGQPAGERPESAARRGALARSDGSLIDCLLSFNPISIGGQSGVILLARDLVRHTATHDEGLALAAQHAPIGVFRASALRRGEFLEINAAARALLPAPASGAPLALADCFADRSEHEALLHKLRTGGEVTGHVLRIASADATVRDVALSARLVHGEQRAAEYIDGVLEDVTAARVQAADRDALIGNLQAPFLFLHQPLSTLSLSTATCKLDASIEQTARAMTEHGASAALITSESAAAVGIVTDRDLRARALADSLDASAAIHTIMSAPLQRIAEQAPVYEALARMGQHGVRHLAVEDADGRIVGVVDDAAVHEFAHGSPVALLSAIAGARSPEQVALLCKRGAAHAAALSSGGAPAHQAMRMRTSLCDAAVQLLIHLAECELGSPPCGFAFIAMGSHGREELTLASDQDNGIVYAPPDGADPETCQDYFLRLGARVCEGLSRAGFPVCRGGVMAENPRWCRSLPDWLSSFDAWVRAAEPQEIADFSISLDFRAVHGDAALAHNMRRRIHAAIADEPAFLIPFAHNALSFKPPFRLLGDIYLGGDAEHAGEIDLKDATMPLVSFARLYALRHQLSESNTRARIAALASAGHLSSASRDETMIAYDFLMQLRLRTQVAALQAGKPPHNSIDPGKLGRFERECLKQAFAQVGALQKKVSYDFAGAA